MATTVLRTPTLRASPPRLSTNSSFISSKFVSVSLLWRYTWPKHCRMSYSIPCSHKLSRGPVKFSHFASHGETSVTDDKEEVEEFEVQQDNSVGAAGVEDGAGEGDNTGTDESPSFIIASLQSYKEALANNDESKVAEIEAFFKSIEDNNIVLERKLDTLSVELSYEKDRIIRISADFDNFRKRTERERLSFITNAQGEVVENLLPVLDNFERAQTQIKVETEKEEKINNSYQGIYKQFVEILGSLGVVPVETIGKPFDPLLHEAIMREDSTEFEEGIVIQEFRRGFKLGDRLLRPSMVKVSAGPGPAKDVPVGPSEDPEAVLAGASKELEGVDATSECRSEPAPTQDI